MADEGETNGLRGRRAGLNRAGILVQEMGKGGRRGSKRNERFTTGISPKKKAFPID